MSKIEEIAILYTKAWRKKITARNKRGDLHRKCRVDGDWDYPLCKEKRLSREKWCAHCISAEKYDQKFNRWSSRASGLLRRLECAVQKSEIATSEKAGKR